MSVQVGTDLIEIERIRRSLSRYARFRERCFTEAERAYCDSRKNPAQSYAGRFAGKEAVGKALGFGVARAFAELEMGADLYCLHRNRWWQTQRGPLLDSGCYVAGLEYATQTAATVLGKPSPAYFDAACRALDAEPSMTWMVGDDLETDVAGARGVGMHAVLVRTGKFRPDAVEASRIRPDGIVSSIAHLPEWLEEHLA